jgi:hypothetical protein
MADELIDLHQSDALEDAIRIQGKAEPVSGMTQPAELERKEAGLPPVVPAPVVTEPEKKEPEVKPEPVVLEDLEKKLATGTEALTADEQAVVDDIKKKEEDAAAEAAKKEAETKADLGKITHNIGGKNYSFEELEKKAREEMKFGNVDLSVEARKNLVETYVKAANRSDAAYAVGERQKAVAAERKQLDAEKLAAKAALDTTNARLKAQQEMLATQRTQMEKRKVNLEKAAKSTITEEETFNEETGRPNLAKQAEYMEKIRAEKELAALAEEEEQVTAESAKLEEAALRNQIDELVFEHPQYKTSEDINEVSKKMRSGGNVTPEDAARVLALIGMVTTASTMKLPLKTVYESQKLMGQTLPEEAAQTTKLEDLPALPKPNQSAADMIRRHRERLAKAPASLGGGGTGGQRGSGKVSRAAEMIAESAEIMGHDNDAREVNKLF